MLVPLLPVWIFSAGRNVFFRLKTASAGLRRLLPVWNKRGA